MEYIIILIVIFFLLRKRDMSIQISSYKPLALTFTLCLGLLSFLLYDIFNIYIPASLPMLLCISSIILGIRELKSQENIDYINGCLFVVTFIYALSLVINELFSLIQ